MPYQYARRAALGALATAAVLGPASPAQAYNYVLSGNGESWGV